MVDSRSDVAFDNIGELRVTYLADSSLPFSRDASGGNVDVGKAVQITAAKTVGLVTAATHRVHGRLDRVEPDGKAVVKVRGFVPLVAAGALAAGVQVIGAAGGNIAAATGGATEKPVGEVIDGSDPTRVMVFLG